jgi:hypothetical protein
VKVCSFPYETVCARESVNVNLFARVDGRPLCRCSVGLPASLSSVREGLTRLFCVLQRLRTESRKELGALIRVIRVMRC